MRVLLLAAALRHAGSLSVAAQQRRRVVRGVLQQELEIQQNARLHLETELTRSRDVVDIDDTKARAKAAKRAEAVPRRLAEVTSRADRLEALLARSRGAADEPAVDALYHEMSEDGLVAKLETFDAEAAARDQHGRPDGFEGLVLPSPRGIPILIARRSFSDELLRRVGRGNDLFFQAVEGRSSSSRVLLRTSMDRSLSKSPRECVEFAADLAAFFGASRGDDDAVEVMYTDARKVAKRGSRVGQLKPKKRLGTVWARPERVADVARAAQEDQGWL